MTKLPWKPIKSVEELSDEIEDTFWRLVHDKWRCEAGGEWRPAVDIYETEDEYFLTADLPGVKPEDMNIEVRRRNVVISGERRFHYHVRRQRNIHCERICGTFYREFRLEHPVDATGVEVSLDYGICEARLPKIPKR